MKNNSNKIILGISIAVLAFLGVVIFSQTDKPSEKNRAKEVNQKIDYSASFAIYTNGTFRIFTGSMYHNLSPDVYIQSNNPNIVRIKKSDLTWRDFFNTLPFSLNEKCLTTGTGETFCSNETHTLQFYLNGSLTQNALDQEIKPGDKLLVTYDETNSDNINAQISSIPNN